MNDSNPSGRVTAAFRHFITNLPKRGQDLEFVLLKAHIMIEAQVRLLLDNRLSNPRALRESNARLECHQAIKLAKAFFPPDFEPQLWDSLEKLNRLRNDIAHTMLTKEALSHKIDAWLKKYPSTLDYGQPIEERFGIALWSLFCWVAELVDAPPVHEKKPGSDNTVTSK